MPATKMGGAVLKLLSHLTVVAVVLWCISSTCTAQCPSPGAYWKCPATERPGAPHKPGITARIQGRYSITQSDPDKPTWLLRDDSSATDDYNTRRLRLAYATQLSDDILGFAQVRRDWGADEFELHDLYLTYSGWDFANLTVGEMATPFDRQFLTSDVKLPLAERPRPGILLIPDRDIGVLLHNAKATDRLGWYAGLYLGNGKLDLSTEGELMPVARVEYLASPTLNVAVNWARKDEHAAGTFQKFLKKNGKAYGLQALYDGQMLTEDVWGLDALYSDDSTSVWAGYSTNDVTGGGQSLDADGWYVHGGHLVPYRGQCNRLELVAGYEEIDPNKAVTDQLDARWLTFGLNYHVKSCQQQWRLEYVVRDEKVNEVSNNTILLEYDFMFTN